MRLFRWLGALVCATAALAPAAAGAQVDDNPVSALVLSDGPPGYTEAPEGEGLGEAGPVDLTEAARLNRPDAPQRGESLLRSLEFGEGYLRTWRRRPRSGRPA